MSVRPIPPAERAWVEYCLAVLALDPETAGDYASAAVGMPCGATRPEFGIAMYDLQCQICNAGWVGIPGDPCTWCQEAVK